MSRKLQIANPDEDLFSALTEMISNGVGRLPIVSPDNKSLVGIMIRTDIAKAIEKHQFIKGHEGHFDSFQPN